MASPFVLILDIGSGTQDVLLYHDTMELENCPKFILPSPAKQVARRIKELTASGRDIYLHGQNMGGGFWRAVKAHQDAGLKVYAILKQPWPWEMIWSRSKALVLY